MVEEWEGRRVEGEEEGEGRRLEGEEEAGGLRRSEAGGKEG